MSDDVNDELKQLCNRLLDLRGVIANGDGDRGVFFHNVYICDAEGVFDMTLIPEDGSGLQIWNSKQGIDHDACWHVLELLRKELVLDRLADV